MDKKMFQKKIPLWRSNLGLVIEIVMIGIAVYIISGGVW